MLDPFSYQHHWRSKSNRQAYSRPEHPSLARSRKETQHGFSAVASAFCFDSVNHAVVSSSSPQSARNHRQTLKSVDHLLRDLIHHPALQRRYQVHRSPQGNREDLAPTLRSFPTHWRAQNMTRPRPSLHPQRCSRRLRHHPLPHLRRRPATVTAWPAGDAKARVRLKKWAWYAFPRPWPCSAPPSHPRRRPRRLGPEAHPNLPPLWRPRRALPAELHPS
mmetsp:Transcript_105749/g.264778  ORF Transcript_105749/g.264778 Transcript_105749/m.264778 type:complete len:219 (-) Transcript_105749:1510-2166(-)